MGGGVAAVDVHPGVPVRLHGKGQMGTIPSPPPPPVCDCTPSRCSILDPPQASTDVRKELEDLRAEHARVVSALAEVTTENDTLKARHEELTEALQSRMREVQRLQILNNCNGRRALRAARETVGDLRLNGSPALNPLQPDRTRTGLRHPV